MFEVNFADVSPRNWKKMQISYYFKFNNNQLLSSIFILYSVLKENVNCPDKFSGLILPAKMGRFIPKYDRFLLVWLN